MSTDRHPAARLRPELLDQLIDEVAEGTGHRGVADLFGSVMAENLAAVAELAPDGTTYLLTGDIPAMWLRDSAAQVRPYLIVCGEDPHLARTLVGVFRRQLEFIALDPYANSFKRGTEPSPHANDRSDAPPQVWERKYEIDSLCFPVELGYALWRITGSSEHLDERFARVAPMILDLWETELDHDRSNYFFERFDGPPTDTLTAAGRGTPVAPTGMSWSGFRPSDDACHYHYNVPGNMFAVVACRYLATIADQVLGDQQLVARATRLGVGLTEGIERHGTVDHPQHGRLYCYETDGLGHQLLMDDANMPSLLSAPLSGYRPADDPAYLATRALILSPDNPYYYSGTAAAGVGSPHTPPGYIWPIALAVQGLTATDREEKLRLIRLLADTTGGTGQMHESFDVNDPSRFTRPWFSWANAMMCELALDLAGRRLDRLIAG